MIGDKGNKAVDLRAMKKSKISCLHALFIDYIIILISAAARFFDSAIRGQASSG